MVLGRSSFQSSSGKDQLSEWLHPRPLYRSELTKCQMISKISYGGDLLVAVIARLVLYVVMWTASRLAPVIEVLECERLQCEQGPGTTHGGDIGGRYHEDCAGYRGEAAVIPRHST